MKSTILFFFLIIVYSNCFAQNKIDTSELKKKLILTEEQNNDWFTKFKIASKTEKNLILKERLTIDTNVIFLKSYPDAHLLKGKKIPNYIPEGKYVGSKILLLINNYVFSERSEEPTLNSNLLAVKKLIDQIEIKDFSTIYEVSAAALYGRMGSWGVVSLTTSDKRSIKLVRNIALKLEKLRNKSRK